VIDAQWSRVTYYVDTPRKVITLTTFRKQRQAERREVARARQAMRASQQAGGPMSNITLDQLRAKYPPEDRNEYDRGYAAAALAGQLAEWSTRCEPGRG